MKKVILVLVLLLLSGCASSSSANTKQDIDSLIKDIDIKDYVRVNNSTKYFSYYIPSDMQEFDANENSCYLTFCGAELIVNLNIAGIINNKYYPENAFKEEGFFNEDNIYYTRSGTISLVNGKSSNYVLKIYKDDLYLIHFVSKESNIYATCSDVDLLNTIKKIFIIATSIDADEEKIIANYSLKDVIDYEKKQISLFDYVLPTNGYLNDLITSVNGEILNNEQEVVEEETNEEVEEIEETDSDDNNS